MSDSVPDRWLKRVWLVNGVALLLLLTLGLGFAAVTALSDWRREPAAVAAAGDVRRDAAA